MQEIKGTAIRIDSASLKTHFEARAARHTKRADEEYKKAKEVRALLGPMERASELSKTSNFMGRDTDKAKELLDRAWDYDRRAARFTALAKYIIPDAHYVLTDHDVSELEISTQFRRQMDL